MAAEDTMQANVFKGDYDGRMRPPAKSQLTYEMKSPHEVKTAAGIGDVSRFVSYPGWRWRIAEDGTAYHEPIPNPVLRLWDRVARRAQLCR